MALALLMIINRIYKSLPLFCILNTLALLLLYSLNILAFRFIEVSLLTLLMQWIGITLGWILDLTSSGILSLDCKG